MTASTDLPLCFNEESGLLLAELCLEAHERTEIILSFGKGTEFAFDYETEKQKTLRFWEGELERINRLSPKISADKELVRAIQNLTVQTLQCFCYYVGEESLVLRQGGLQRLIWPWEAMNAIDALTRIGSFEDYIEPVLQMYFETMHRENGEINNIGEGWASVTSSALCSLVKYCAATNNRELWKKYREKALKTFEWIRQKRRSTKGDPKAISGLFPAMRGNDWPDVFQHWTVTDCFALVALDEMASMLEKFGDPAASAVRAEYLDYKSVIRGLVKRFAPEDAEEIRIPLTADGNDCELINSFYPYLHQPMPLMVLKNEITLRDVERLYKYFVRVGLTQNGLYDRMPYKNGNTHIWYTSIAEYEWFTLWLHFGVTHKAQEIIEAQFRYSMTDEYYMIERYADNDPYFVPWSPNVSAMGRLIIMLTEFYK